MKTRILTRGVAAAFTVLLVWAICPAAGETVTVTIYNTGDYHEHTANIPRIAQFIQDRKAADPNTLFVDVGDTFNKGELASMYSRGEAMCALLGAAGYDACIMGNHDFSFGAKQYRRLVERFDLPLLAANCTWQADAKPKNAAPYRVFQLKGVSVAVIGTASEYMNHASDRLITVSRVDKAIAGLVGELRKKADIVVLLTHLGTKRDRQIARAVPGIDLIVGGHDHARFTDMVLDADGRTVIQHSDSRGGSIGEVTLEWDGKRIAGRKVRLIKVTNSMPENAKVKAVRAKYHNALRPDSPIAEVQHDMPRGQLTLWLAEAIRKHAAADVVLTPDKLVTGGLGKGKLTPRALLKVVPRLEVVRFSVAGPGRLERLIERIRRRNKSIISHGRIPEAAGKIIVAYPCVRYDRPLDTKAVGLDTLPASAIERLGDRSLWQIAIQAARTSKLLKRIDEVGQKAKLAFPQHPYAMILARSRSMAQRSGSPAR